jgi:putative sterol carrier protein
MTDSGRLKPLVDAGVLDVGSTLEVAVERAAAAGLEGKVELTLVEEAESSARTWHADLKRKTCKEVKGKRRAGADVELVMSAATWTEIAAGRLGPMEAFGAGRLRIRGDVHRARILYGPLLDEPVSE